MAKIQRRSLVSERTFRVSYQLIKTFTGEIQVAEEDIEPNRVQGIDLGPRVRDLTKYIDVNDPPLNSNIKERLPRAITVIQAKVVPVSVEEKLAELKEVFDKFPANLPVPDEVGKYIQPLMNAVVALVGPPASLKARTHEPGCRLHVNHLGDCVNSARTDAVTTSGECPDGYRHGEYDPYCPKHDRSIFKPDDNGMYPKH